jgi:signal transduction histidine kinase
MKRPRIGTISIRRQLIIGVAMVHLLLMSIFVLDLTARERRFLTEGAKNRALFQANVLATASVPHVIVDDFAGLSEVVDVFSRDRSIRYAMVTDTRGQILSHNDHAKVRQHLQDAKSLHVIEGPVEAQFLSENAQTVQAAAPITVQGRTIGWAWLGIDRSADQRYLGYVTRSGLLYMMAAVLIGTVFAIVLATTITRPLRLLLLGAKRLSQDRLDVPVPVTSKNEVGVVTRAFNAAMERITRQRRELRSAHDELEKRVQERTAELAQANAVLAQEIQERTGAQNALRKAHIELEDRVRERTAELAQTNAALESEILERRRAEEALKRANESLERSNQDLEQFAYAASHDLQEPLRTIKNFTALLAKRYSGNLDADADEFIGYVVDGADRMETLIRDLLTYSRAGRTDKELARVDCGQALEAALSNLRGAIESSGATISSDALPEVTANQVELVQLFQNLVGNGIKYRSGERTPRIHVAASTGIREWIFEVRDNGIGIQMVHQQRIFGVFQRLHGKELPGSGIGLATCSRIVARLGGRIWVESTYGTGSIFKFSIPMGQAALPGAGFQARPALLTSDSLHQ